MIIEWQTQAFSPPYSQQGQSALLAAPPWHYAGWMLNVAFEFSPSIAQGWVPAELGEVTGQGCVHVADWQACSDRNELIDPVYSQYKESIVIIQIKRPDGSLASFCPGIWVDQDISLVRGLLQGWPKKFGQTWLTRSLPLSHPAAAPLVAGTQFGASLCVKDRRLLAARAQMTGRTGQAFGFLKDPVIGLVGFPDLSAPTQLPKLHVVRAAIGQLVQQGWHEVNAELEFYPHPFEEVSVLGVLQVTGASIGWLGLTITGTDDV